MPLYHVSKTAALKNVLSSCALIIILTVFFLTPSFFSKRLDFRALKKYDPRIKKIQKAAAAAAPLKNINQNQIPKFGLEKPFTIIPFNRDYEQIVIAVFSNLEDRALAVQKTWIPLAQALNISVIFFGENDYQWSEKFVKYGVGFCPTAQTGCRGVQSTIKTLKIYQKTYELFPSIKLFMKVDDDTAINVTNLYPILREWLKISETTLALTGQCEDQTIKNSRNPNAVKNNPSRFHCGGGAGFMMTRALFLNFALADGFNDYLFKCQYRDWPDDVFTTRCAQSLNAQIILQEHFYFESAPKGTESTWVTQHHLSPTKMLLWYHRHKI